MKKQIFKNVDLLMASKDKKNLEKMLLEPVHENLNVSLAPVLETDNQGRIVFFMPIGVMKYALVHYLQNLMIRQRLYQMDEFLDKQKAENNE